VYDLSIFIFFIGLVVTACVGILGVLVFYLLKKKNGFTSSLINVTFLFLPLVTTALAYWYFDYYIDKYYP